MATPRLKIDDVIDEDVATLRTAHEDALPARLNRS
jgi:hypothetical protein